MGCTGSGVATPALTTAQQNCLKLVPPSTTVSNAYPIVAFTYINTYYSGHAAAQATALKNLLKTYYTVNASGAPTGPALPVGYSYLSANAGFRGLANSAITGCIN